MCATGGGRHRPLPHCTVGFARCQPGPCPEAAHSPSVPRGFASRRLNVRVLKVVPDHIYFNASLARGYGGLKGQLERLPGNDGLPAGEKLAHSCADSVELALRDHQRGARVAV
jgi:hypothetical protein